MSRHEPGEYAEIHWGGDEPEYEMVHGHVDQDAFDANVRGYREAMGLDVSHLGKLRPAVHTYCRIIPDTTGDYAFVYFLTEEPGRGAFKVTVAHRGILRADALKKVAEVFAVLRGETE